eukprot:GHRQ01011162.1.p1 GENE.GHRQ01011162.1~~GHRQ01011162.1.p1  ORF type:complete len:298 (+),score=112.39 GHRQ01011162.1:139-1032(+)
MHAQLVPGHSALESTRPDTKQLKELRKQRKALVKTGATAVTKKSSAAAQQSVSVKLTNISFSSRLLNATAHIAAPVEVVWAALTDYDNLASFIPSLVENKCLERRPHGCLLRQVGSQDIALGMKFSAACTLEIVEYPQGIPDGLCSDTGNWDEHFPNPGGSASTSGDNVCSSSSESSSCDGDGAAATGVRDLSFSLVEGDFQAFKGVWRMEPGDDPASTVLHYAAFVQPHAWLPVGLIQGRISSEVVGNLKAVARHAEHLHRQQLKQQQLAGIGCGSSSSSSSVGRDAGEAADQAAA